MAFNPAAKIVLVLRHPAERAFSSYIYYFSDGLVTQSFSEHLALCLKDGGPIGHGYPCLEIGLYGQQMERLLSHVPREQVRVWLYEETIADPDKFFGEVLTFLEVDAGFRPDRSRRHLQMAVPKMAGVTRMLRRSGLWDGVRDCIPQRVRPMLRKAIYQPRGAMKMSAEDRRFLVKYYRDDVLKLERVIERDLSRWLQ